LNLQRQVITKLFSLYEYESPWNKPLHELYSRTYTFPVLRQYDAGRLKHKKPQPLWSFLCLVRWNMQVTKTT